MVGMTRESALGGAAGEPLATTGIVDSHVHVWDPSVLRYPWLDGLPTLDRPFLLPDYASATAAATVDTLILVEANCLPDQALREVELFEHVATSDPRNQRGQTLLNSRNQTSLTPLISGIVAFVPLTASATLDQTLDELTKRPMVKGIRHNIQGEPPGFCTRPSFIEAVQKAGSRGLTFDLCATHGQLRDVLQLVRECPNTRFILDHCGKPAIRDGLVEPWSADIACLAKCANVWCKLSGLMTEAAHVGWREADLIPYASHVVETFGTERVMYGSDWPVLTLAAGYADWFQFTARFTATWSDGERRGFYQDNARRAYAL
jgi:L-fuconolactonase